MFVNGIGHPWIGYLASMLVIPVLIFRTFGSSWLRSLMHGVIASKVTYILFFRIMELCEPGGRILVLGDMLLIFGTIWIATLTRSFTPPEYSAVYVAAFESANTPCLARR